MKLIQGDCLEVMRDMAEKSIDSIVTDPPYGLSFMGKEWDHGVPGVHFWEAALRVVKPGSHLLAFGGTRTFHRLTCAIEDAGWEIRDCLGWVYGSGFPKSLDVSKAIDRAAGAEREIVGGHNKSGNIKGGRLHAGSNEIGVVIEIPHTVPATDAARQWSGWGTALKPAWEPIILARKPLEGTVAENVQRYGTGALNIDGSRIGTNAGWSYPNGRGGEGWHGRESLSRNLKVGMKSTAGRWPANLIHDGSEEVLELFPQSGRSTKPSRTGGHFRATGAFPIDSEPVRHEDNGGSAARFFYCAKASRREREAGCEGAEKPMLWSSGTKNPGSFQSPNTNRAAKNNHPTVKPLALMRYLCQLVTPLNGIILDPFMGSGTTGIAAKAGGFGFIGIEIDAGYMEIAKKRIGVASARECAPLSLEANAQ